MGRPTFLLIQLLDSVNDIDDYITREEIETNIDNIKLNLDYKLVEVSQMKSIYLYDKRLVGERERTELANYSDYLINKELEDFDKRIKDIEAIFEFEILEKSMSFGYIKLNGKSVSLLFIPNSKRQETDKVNFEILNYSYITKEEGFYDETIAFEYDIMNDKFYGEQFPHYIGLKSELLEISKYVKPELRNDFEVKFIKKFKEGKNIFHWDY